MANIKYNQIIMNIFKRCSARIKERFDFLNSQIKDTRMEPDKHDSLSNVINKLTNDKITYSSICPNDDKLISRIMNCKLTENNPYLLTDNAIYNELDIGDGNKIELGLLKVLKFENRTELLWGNNEEIEKYIKDIYDDIIFTLATNTIKFNDFSLDMILIDYVDFALYSAYHTFDKINDDNTTIPLMFYGMTYNEIDTKYFDTLFESADILYSKCKNDFKEIFISFIYKTDSFKKIDKIIENDFIHEMFIPMLISKYKPDDKSLGVRVKNLIENDFQHIPELLFNGKNTPNYNYKFPLFNATAEYVNKLSKIQKNKSN